MAKEKKEVKRFEFSKVGTILDNMAKSTPILIEKEIISSLRAMFFVVGSLFLRTRK